MENENTSSTTNEGLKEMDGDVQYAEGYIHLIRLCAHTAAIL